MQVKRLEVVILDSCFFWLFFCIAGFAMRKHSCHSAKRHFRLFDVNDDEFLQFPEFCTFVVCVSDDDVFVHGGRLFESVDLNHDLKLSENGKRRVRRHLM